MVDLYRFTVWRRYVSSSLLASASGGAKEIKETQTGKMVQRVPRGMVVGWVDAWGTLDSQLLRSRDIIPKKNDQLARSQQSAPANAIQ